MNSLFKRKKISTFNIFLTLGTLISAFSSSQAQIPDCSNTPDLVYYNGIIITMDPSNPIAEAIAIKGDSILAIGTNDEIFGLSSTGCGSRLVDLNGLTILPGFNDSHSHWFSWREHICSVTEETTYPALEEIMEMLAQNGWTSISELNFGRPDYAPEHLENAFDLDSRGELKVRLNAYWGTLDDVSLINVLEDSGRTPSTFYTDLLHVKGVKMYVDDPFGTTDILTQAQVNELVEAAHEKGWQIAAHAVNESAVEKILNAFESILGEESNEKYRHRIEHAVKVSDDQLQRMKQKEILASIQLLGPPDWPEQETFQTYISNTDSIWCLRWKDFIEAEPEGLRITGSTDGPFNDAPCEYSPFRIIYQAVSRNGYLERDHADWELNQRLTIEESLRLLTINGAWATFDEEKKGSLTAGKWADLTLVSQNPLEISDPEDLLDIIVLQTMVGGRVTYCHPQLRDEFCDPSEIFVSDSVRIKASEYLADQTPDKAYDNDIETNWGSGNYAPQWIEFDLGKDRNIGRIEFVIDQWPAGFTNHQIWAKEDDDQSSFELIHEFNQYTEFGETLTFTATTDISAFRYFHIRTIESPSWVSWKEIKFYEKDLTSIKEQNLNLPNSYVLNQNYPNPFNPETVIEYQIPQKEHVKLKIYDDIGREIITLIDAPQEAGRYKIVWNGMDRHNNPVASGTYIYQIITDNYKSSKKIVFIK